LKEFKTLSYEHFLFPNWTKIGWYLFIPSVIFHLLTIFQVRFGSVFEYMFFAYMRMESDKPGFFQIIQDSFAYELLSMQL
jgi:hypothetical protein